MLDGELYTHIFQTLMYSHRRRKLTLLYLFTDLFSKEIFSSFIKIFARLLQLMYLQLMNLHLCYRLFREDFSLIVGTNRVHFIQMQFILLMFHKLMHMIIIQISYAVC